MFICPVCGVCLEKQDNRYICGSGHSYDIASSGYVNLLPPGKPSHGDDKLMIGARSRFLGKGFYAPLLEALVAEISGARSSCGEKMTVVDAGCGEGWYTDGIEKRLAESGIPHMITGIDISKAGIIKTARRNKNIACAVASVYALPLPDGYADVVLSVFSPFAEAEFLRILKPGGLCIQVIPGERHLFGLKELLYDSPYENKPEPYGAGGFELLGVRSLDYRISLTDGDTISDLFAMTPYFYTTRAEDRAGLSGTDSLETEVSFRVITYKKL